MAYLTTLVFMIQSLLFVHDLHLSKTTINVNTMNNTIEISTHLFLDDLENALILQGYEELKLFTEKEVAIADSAVVSYIEKHLSLRVDSTEVDLEYFGRESSEDYQAIWAYFVVDNISDITSVEVRNNYFHELFDDQRNLITLRKDKRTVKNALLDRRVKSFRVDNL